MLAFPEEQKSSPTLVLKHMFMREDIEGRPYSQLGGKGLQMSRQKVTGCTFRAAKPESLGLYEWSSIIQARIKPGSNNPAAWRKLTENINMPSAPMRIGAQQLENQVMIQKSQQNNELPYLQIMDAKTALNRLSTYAAFSIRTPTRAGVEILDERLSKDDILRQINRLMEKGPSVEEKMSALAPKQADHINRLLGDMSKRERDGRFEWTIVQFEQTFTHSSEPKSKTFKQLRESVIMNVFLARSPLKHLDARLLYHDIEAQKSRLREASRLDAAKSTERMTPPKVVISPARYAEKLKIGRTHSLARKSTITPLNPADKDTKIAVSHRY